MIKVIIADDEILIRTVIKNTLPFESMDLVLLSEATNGNEAFEQCLKLRPDVLITDVRMPGLSGLDLIESLRKNLPSLKTIIISGYSDFEYVRRAIRLGAFDYLLKPVDKQEIFRVLSRVKEEIENEKSLSGKVNESLSISKELLLNDMISSNRLFPDNVIEKLNFKFDSTQFELILISIDDYICFLNSIKLTEKQKVLLKLKGIATRFAKHYFQGNVIANNKIEGEFILIYNSNIKIDNDFIKEKMILLRRIFYRHTSLSLTVGISSQSTGIGKLNQLYSEAKFALSFRMINGKGSINFFEGLNNQEVGDFKISKNLVDEIILGIELLSSDNINSKIDNLFKLISTYKAASPSIIKTKLLDFVVEVLMKLNCKSFFIKNLSETGVPVLFEEYGKIFTFEELSIYLKKVFQIVINDRIAELRVNPQNTIEMAKKYINENYYKDIQLELISNYVFLNPTYFSQFFKKETGQNFSEFLSFVRIEKAKELLKSTNLKVYEICEKVGYSDTKHFTKLFKKLTGMCPSEFKEVR